MSTATEPKTIAAMIREALDRVEQPRVNDIADLVTAELDVEQLRHYAVIGVSHRVRVYLDGLREPAPITSSARWDAVKEHASSGGLDLDRYMVNLPGGAKWLKDCTAPDLVAAAELHEQVAAGHLMSAKQMRALADLLGGSQTVRDLPEADVRQVLDA